MTSFGVDEVTRLRIALSRTVRELERRSTSGEDLTRTQLSVLGLVAHRGRVGLAQLAELERVNPTMLSRIVGKLEADGLMRRVPDDADRRVAHVEITPHGRDVWDRNANIRSELLGELLAELAPDEVAALRAAIPALEVLAEVTRRPLVRRFGE